MASRVEREFHQTMIDLHRAAEAIGYRATVFIGMVQQRGGLATAKALINSSRPTDGYTKLFELGRLDLSVEAVVIDNPAWHELFTAEELLRARKRLKDHRYQSRA
jgi:hypothetical protein